MTGATPVGGPAPPPSPPRRDAGEPSSAGPLGTPPGAAGTPAAGRRSSPGAPDPSGRVGGLVDVFA
jgi:hypothetical protein